MSSPRILSTLIAMIALVAFVSLASAQTIFVGSNKDGDVDGLSFDDEDILEWRYEAGKEPSWSWSLYFDGSDVGFGGDIDAFYVLEDGNILLSLDRSRSIQGLGKVDDSDIIQFKPTSLGRNTAGSFHWYLDGSDVGLTRSDEDIDAIAFSRDGELVVSTTGSFDVPGTAGKDEDLILLKNGGFGASTTGTWEMYFDGSDVDLTRSREDIRAAWIDGDTGEIYLTTKGSFSVNGGVSGDALDIFICKPSSLGKNTACTYSLFWDGSDAGLNIERVDGISITDSNGGNNDTGGDPTGDPGGDSTGDPGGDPTGDTGGGNQTSADLALTKTDAADPVTVGDDITYTITIGNNGPDTAEAVVLTDTLPSGVTFVSASPSSANCSQGGGVVTCNLGDINSGANVVVSIVTTATATESITNNASVTSDTEDPNPVNNSASEDTTVNAIPDNPTAADLAITKSDAADPVTVGDDITYTINISNNGPDTAVEVVLTDTLPSGVNFVSASPSSANCGQGGGVVTCNLGDINGSTNVVVSIVTTATAAQSITNNASVTSDTEDPNLANNSANEGTTISAADPGSGAGPFDVQAAHKDLLAEATGYFAHAGGTGGKGGDIYYVTNLNDSGPGSLRAGAERSGPTIILFENGVDGIIRLSDDIEVKSNKTIWGRHRDGSSANIFVDPDPDSGAGFKVRGSNRNVIISNFKGDADGLGNDDAPDFINIQGSGGLVWVHHVTVIGDGSGNMDGFVDVHATNVTLSWNRVENWDNVTLIYSYPTSGRDIRVTMNHNLIRTSAGRQPKTSNSAVRVHAYNNWLDRWGYDGMRTAGGEILAESNIFTAGGDTRAIQGTWDGSGNLFLNGADADSKSTVFTPPYSYVPDPTGGLRARLEAEAGWQASF